MFDEDELVGRSTFDQHRNNGHAYFALVLIMRIRKEKKMSVPDVLYLYLYIKM